MTVNVFFYTHGRDSACMARKTQYRKRVNIRLDALHLPRGKTFSSIHNKVVAINRQISY